MKPARILSTLAIVAALSGCGTLLTTYHGVAGWTSRQWSAEKAWRDRKWMYADIPCRGSFKAGFKAGYRFANGGYDSCEPPQSRHYWRIGGLTQSERQNAQAWSDGFTHGTVAARQDCAVGPSALDMAAMQPPEGVPDVRYYAPPQNPTEMGQNGAFPYSPGAQWPAPYPEQAMPGSQGPPMMGQNVPYAPDAASMPYAPNPSNFQNSWPPAPTAAPAFAPAPAYAPAPAPASEAMPSPSTQLPPFVMPPPPPAPASLPAADARFLPGPLIASEGAPGFGVPRWNGNLQPAPPAEPAEPLPQQPVGIPPQQTTQAADWELPLIRN